MKIEIVGSPEFELEIEVLVVEALMLCSKHHYDGICQIVGKPKGFLYGWNNIALWAKEEGRKECEVSGKFRHLDTTLKLCEIAGCLSLITDEMRRVLREYAQQVRTALQRANEITDWKIVL